MFRNILNISIVTVLLSSACTSTVEDFEFKSKESKLVMFAECQPDSGILMSVTRSMSLTEPIRYRPESDVKINLQKPDGSLINFNRVKEGWYAIDNPELLAGKTYTITANNGALKPAIASFEIPTLCKVNNISVSEKKRNINELFYSGEDAVFSTISIDIEDDINTEDYYYIMATGRFYGKYIFHYDWQWDEHGGYYVVGDTISKREFIDPLKLKINNTFIDLVESNGKFKPIRSDSYIYAEKLIFSDKLFNGRKTRLNLELNGYYINYVGDITSVEVTVKKVSSAFYNYAKSAAIQESNYDDIFAEPVSVNSEIENGFGMVFGSNHSVHHIDGEDFPLMNEYLKDSARTSGHYWDSSYLTY